MVVAPFLSSMDVELPVKHGARLDLLVRGFSKRVVQKPELSDDMMLTFLDEEHVNCFFINLTKDGFFSLEVFSAV